MIPLAEFMHKLDEAKTYLPVLKYLPQKVSNLEIEIMKLKDTFLKNYVTFA
jgi:hypothetical protein